MASSSFAVVQRQVPLSVSFVNVVMLQEDWCNFVRAREKELVSGYSLLLVLFFTVVRSDAVFAAAV